MPGLPPGLTAHIMTIAAARPPRLRATQAPALASTPSAVAALLQAAARYVYRRFLGGSSRRRPHRPARVVDPPKRRRVRRPHRRPAGAHSAPLDRRRRLHLFGPDLRRPASGRRRPASRVGEGDPRAAAQRLLPRRPVVPNLPLRDCRVNRGRHPDAVQAHVSRRVHHKVAQAAQYLPRLPACGRGGRDAEGAELARPAPPGLARAHRG